MTFCSPWKPHHGEEELEDILFHAMEISRIATELMAPVVPNAAKRYTGMSHSKKRESERERERWGEKDRFMVRERKGERER